MVAFVIAALLCAIVIVGPLRALVGASYRLVQLGGIVLAVLLAGFVLTYVLPFLFAIVLGVVGFAFLVWFFVSLFSPSAEV